MLKSTSGSEHFLQWSCPKSAYGCGAKQISNRQLLPIITEKAGKTKEMVENRQFSRERERDRKSERERKIER